MEKVMKRLYSLTILFFALLMAGGVFLTGCDRPEVPRSEYGTILEDYPDMSNAKPLPLPEGVDLPNRNAESN